MSDRIVDWRSTISKGIIIELIENRKFGDYRLLERIAKGGLATIWLANDANGKPVALRVMHDTFGLVPRDPNCFGAAARLWRVCRHTPMWSDIWVRVW